MEGRCPTPDPTAGASSPAAVRPRRPVLAAAAAADGRSGAAVRGRLAGLQRRGRLGAAVGGCRRRGWRRGAATRAAAAAAAAVG